jgi:hypothetical protein
VRGPGTLAVDAPPVAIGLRRLLAPLTHAGVEDVIGRVEDDDQDVEVIDAGEDGQ